MVRFIPYLKYLLKSKHKYGFGIHSPYLFHLQTVIVEEELPYYCYFNIERVRKQCAESSEKLEDGSSSLGEFTKGKSHKAKYDQLTFRLANYFSPNKMLLLGDDSGFTTAYLASHHKKTSLKVSSLVTKQQKEILGRNRWSRFSNVEFLPDGNYKKVLNENTDCDLLYIADSEIIEDCIDDLSRWLAGNSKDAMVIVREPYKTEQSENQWKKLITQNIADASLDFFHLGVLIKKSELTKSNLIVKY